MTINILFYLVLSGNSYPLAKIGVSGKLQEVCSRLSSLGLCADRFGNAPDIIRLLELADPGKSCGRVPGAWGDIVIWLLL